MIRKIAYKSKTRLSGFILFVSAQSSSCQNMPSSATKDKGFRKFVAVSKDDKRKLMDSCTTKATKTADKTWKKAFEDFLVESKAPNSTVETLDLDAAPESLENFYAAVRRRDGGTLVNNTMKAARCALNRVFKNLKGKNIVTDPAFAGANAIFHGITRVNKAKGYGNTVSKKPITNQDLEAINKYFEGKFAGGEPSPYELQRYVFFQVCKTFL